MKIWKGCIGYDREGIEQYRDFETEAEAKAYQRGAEDMKEICESGLEDPDMFNPLEDYWTSVTDQELTCE